MQAWGFWAAVIALVLGVTGLFVQALRRGEVGSDDTSALKVYRDQLAEVDRDLARDILTQAEAERLRIEVSRRLLEADRTLKQGAVAQTGTGILAPALVVLAVLGLAVAGYARLGAPNYPDLPLVQRLQMAEETYRNRPSQAQAEAVAKPAPPPEVDQSYLDLIQKLRDAVAARPDDQQGLELLARNEAQLGNYIAARKAAEHLIALKQDQATAADHVALAEIMVLAAGGYVSPEAEQQLIQTLQLEPTNPMARYYSGLMFAQVGRPDRTFDFWEPLLREGPDDAPWIGPIRAGLQDVADMAGIKYALPTVGATGNGPTAEDVAAAGAMSGDARAAMIKGMVEQLNARLTSDGGPPEEWAKLINALGVLGDLDAARVARGKAEAAFAGNEAALAMIAEAAQAAGIAP